MGTQKVTDMSISPDEEKAQKAKAKKSRPKADQPLAEKVKKEDKKSKQHSDDAQSRIFEKGAAGKAPKEKSEIAEETAEKTEDKAPKKEGEAKKSEIRGEITPESESEEKPDKETKEEYPSTDAQDVAKAPEEPVKVHKSVKPNVKKHVHGKNYRKIEGLVEKGKEYSLDEAVELLKKTSVSKFDGSVEVHINLNIDPANADHQVRGSVALPAGSGRTKKVCVVCDAGKEKEAKDAGAETVGGQNIIDKIEKGWLDFDVLVATPDMMGALGKIGKILGTKGLMPNPKTGTVTQDVGRVVTEIKKGRAEYRADAQGIVHTVIGKVSFSAKDLKDNYVTLMDAIHHAKPASLKGTFIKSIYLTTTMGPGIKLSEK